jgi:hypothetical protein
MADPDTSSFSSSLCLLKAHYIRPAFDSHLQRRDGPLVCPRAVVLDHSNYW